VSDIYVRTLLVVSALWVAFEIALVVRRRAGGQTSKKDAGTLRVLNLVIYGAIGLGWYLAARGVGAVRLPPWGLWAGLVAIAGGMMFRLWAIITLGRFFTVDVAIHSGHQLVEAGPYRWIRHPAYTGSLLSFVGLAVCTSSWVAAAIMIVAITGAFVHRIRVEEAALQAAFPDAYPEYAGRTSRLVPGVY
jgi:protein-S-isoprenylcysteine O-methyltransferase